MLGGSSHDDCAKGCDPQPDLGAENGRSMVINHWTIHWGLILQVDNTCHEQKNQPPGKQVAVNFHQLYP